jgi:hypothetical protein
MTLSTPIKIVALAGLALVLGGAGILFLVSRHGTSTTVPPVQHAPAAASVVVHIAQKTQPAKHKALELNPALPSSVAAKLQHSHKIVAFVYTAASASDRALLARAGAHSAHVPFVALDVTNERTAEAVYTWLGSAADPAMVVVKRPGTLAFSSNGALDRSIVEQAAAEAR